MIQGNGTHIADLSNLADGVYLISITTGTINYSDKIELTH